MSGELQRDAESREQEEAQRALDIDTIARLTKERDEALARWSVNATAVKVLEESLAETKERLTMAFAKIRELMESRP